MMMTPEYEHTTSGVMISCRMCNRCRQCKLEIVKVFAVYDSMRLSFTFWPQVLRIRCHAQKKMHGVYDLSPARSFLAGYQLAWAHSRLDPSSQTRPAEMVEVWVAKIYSDIKSRFGKAGANILDRGIDKAIVKPELQFRPKKVRITA